MGRQPDMGVGVLVVVVGGVPPVVGVSWALGAFGNLLGTSLYISPTAHLLVRPLPCVLRPPRAPANSQRSQDRHFTSCLSFLIWEGRYYHQFPPRGVVVIFDEFNKCGHYVISASG